MSNPYTTETNRLADVIAAIQVLGTYKFYKSTFSKWSDRIEGDEDKGEYWKNIFEAHPEFFRIDSTGTKASLVWRRNYPKRYNVDTGELITREEFDVRVKEKKLERISRTPLSREDILGLIDTAINLHSNELSHKQDNRWLINLIAGLAGVIVGALIG